MTHEYEDQAKQFLRDVGASITIKKIGTDYYFPDDTSERDIYRVTIKRNDKTDMFRFGQSVHKSGYPSSGGLCQSTRCKCRWGSPLPIHPPTPPTAYDVIASLIKSDPGSIDDFASEYGFRGEHPSKIIRLYGGAVEEWHKVYRLFGDVLDGLREIC